jgi:hypothetical protein
LFVAKVVNLIQGSSVFVLGEFLHFIKPENYDFYTYKGFSWKGKR